MAADMYPILFQVIGILVGAGVVWGTIRGDIKLINTKIDNSNVHIVDAKTAVARAHERIDDHIANTHGLK